MMHDATKEEAYDMILKLSAITDAEMLKGMLGAVAYGWAKFRTEDGVTPSFCVTLEGQKDSEEFRKTGFGAQLWAKMKWDDARGRLKMPCNTKKDDSQEVKPTNRPS